MDKNDFENFKKWCQSAQAYIDAGLSLPSSQKKEWVWNDRFEDIQNDQDALSFIEGCPDPICAVATSDDWFEWIISKYPASLFVSPSVSHAQNQTSPLTHILANDNVEMLKKIPQYMAIHRQWSGMHASYFLLGHIFEHSSLKCLSYLLKNQNKINAFNATSLTQGLSVLTKNGNDSAPLVKELLRARYDELRKISTSWVDYLSNFEWMERSEKPFNLLVEEIDVVLGSPSFYTTASFHHHLSFLVLKNFKPDDDPLMISVKEIFLHQDFPRVAFFENLNMSFQSKNAKDFSKKIVSWWPEEELHSLFIKNGFWEVPFIEYNNTPELSKIEIQHHTAPTISNAKTQKKKLL